MAQEHIRQRLQFVPGIARAGGIAGRVEDEPAGFGRDRGLERLWRQFEAGFDACGGNHRLAARQEHHVGVADPIGGGDQHLVPGIERGHEGVVEDLLAARGDADLRGHIIEPVVALELGADRRLELGNAVHGGVFGLAFLDGADTGGADMRGGREIRLSGPQADHVAPCGLEFLGLGGDGDGGRGFDARQCRGKTGHGRLRFEFTPRMS